MASSKGEDPAKEPKEMISKMKEELGQNAAYFHGDDVHKPMKLEADPIGMGKEKKRAQTAAAARKTREDADMENNYSEDPSKLDMIGNLTSSRLLEISERFDLYPNG
jgi:hypothetical protein